MLKSQHVISFTPKHGNILHKFVCAMFKILNVLGRYKDQCDTMCHQCSSTEYLTDLVAIVPQ